MIDRVQAKAEAKGILRTAKVSPLLMTLIVLAITFVLSRVQTLVETGSVFPQPFDYYEEYYDALINGDYATLMELGDTFSGGGAFLSLLVGLFVTVLKGGYYIYHMGIRQGQEMPYASLCDGLGVAGKLIWCSLLMGIKIALWSMLFFIPGIVAAYRYRFAIYNILTDSSLTGNQAIKLSCEQTQGMKGQLFVLDLSFIGWGILSAVTAGILDIWVMPYKAQCDLAYFEAAQSNLGRNPYGVQ